MVCVLACCVHAAWVLCACVRVLFSVRVVLHVAIVCIEYCVVYLYQRKRKCCVFVLHVVLCELCSVVFLCVLSVFCVFLVCCVRFLMCCVRFI